MFINKVIHYQKNSSVRYGTPKPNVRKFHCRFKCNEFIYILYVVGRIKMIVPQRHKFVSKFCWIEFRKFLFRMKV